MKRSRWIAVSLLVCLGVAAAQDGLRLSFAPYSKISARRLETMRLVRDGKFDAAEALLAAVQQAYEGKEADEFAVGTAFAAFSTSDESLASPLDRWVEQMPQSWCALLARARHQRARFNRGMSRKLAVTAIADYQAALAMNPRLMVAYSDLIELAGATRDEALFRETVDTGLALAPASWAVRDALVRVGGVPQAEFASFLADAEKHAKENPLLWQLRSDVELERGRALWDQNRIEEALAIYESQAKSLDTFQIHKERARLLRILKRYGEAGAAIDHAIALLPGKYDGYRERGWLRLMTDREPEAVAEFRRGLEIEPHDPELNYGLGQALEYTGDKLGAMAAYEESTRWSSFPAAQRRLDRLRSRTVARPPAAPR